MSLVLSWCIETGGTAGTTNMCYFRPVNHCGLLCHCSWPQSLLAFNITPNDFKAYSKSRAQINGASHKRDFYQIHCTEVNARQQWYGGYITNIRICLIFSRKLA